jgi:hypothetical protein
MPFILWEKIRHVSRILHCEQGSEPTIEGLATALWRVEVTSPAHHKEDTSWLRGV